MSAVPSELDTERGPPMAVPLAHFLVGLGWLLASVAVGLADALGAGGLLGPAQRHLFLIGWVCITIMGAMTQFVPVWSGRQLHSRRLARVQLWFVGAGLVVLVTGFIGGRLALLPVGGTLLVVGLWTFAWNIARTLPPVRALDVTERHFALALVYLVAVTTAGWLLAAAHTGTVPLPVARSDMVGGHVTLAVFGVVVTPVIGALYQLAPMFTGTDHHGVDEWFRRVEEVGYPVGVLALASGRLIGAAPLARAGAVLLLGGLAAFLVVLARRLVEASTEQTPMRTRYTIALAALVGWVVITTPVWLKTPLAADRLFGASATLLLVGGVGFVILGTLYHVVPFIVWERQYSDRLGLEPVPVVGDLYDARAARTDAVLLVTATTLLVAHDFGAGRGVALAGWSLALVGFGLATANLSSVVRDHGPRSVVRALVQ